MPIRIIRVKRPPRQEALLREIAAKLQQFGHGFGQPQLFGETERCIGCGKLGIFLCRHCSEFLRAVDKKKLEQSQKLMSTVEQRFAAQHFE
jgi:hypothetical protein